MGSFVIKTQRICVFISPEWKANEHENTCGFFIYVRELLCKYITECDVFCSAFQYSELNISEHKSSIFLPELQTGQPDYSRYNYCYILHNTIWTNKSLRQSIEKALTKNKNTAFFLWSTYFTIPYPIKEKKDLLEVNIKKNAEINQYNATYKYIQDIKHRKDIKEKKKNTKSGSTVVKTTALDNWVDNTDSAASTSSNISGTDDICASDEGNKRKIAETADGAENSAKIKRQMTLCQLGISPPEKKQKNDPLQEKRVAPIFFRLNPKKK